MKYFLDTEFIEGPQDERGWFGLKLSVWNWIATMAYLLIWMFCTYYTSATKLYLWLFSALFFLALLVLSVRNQRNSFQTLPTIDLISIGMVDENGREYYAISKEFNLREAWNRYDLDCGSGDQRNYPPKKVYWIRENVLKPIFLELFNEWMKGGMELTGNEEHFQNWFSFFRFEDLIKKYGKHNYEIANEIVEFIYGKADNVSGMSALEEATKYEINDKSLNPEFYAYYANYDWVAFCWLFGKMMDLPKGFPMYCRDLKQTMDEKVNDLKWMYGRDCWSNNGIDTIGTGECQEKDRLATFEEKFKTVKKLKEYPKQTNEHNALEDAKWNLKLFQFLQKL